MHCRSFVVVNDDDNAGLELVTTTEPSNYNDYYYCDDLRRTCGSWWRSNHHDSANHDESSHGCGIQLVVVGTHSTYDWNELETIGILCTDSDVRTNLRIEDDNEKG